MTNKTLFKMCLAGVLTTLTAASPALALDCSLGTPITGADGSTAFCKSTVTMNWWSAFNWCSAIGGRLVNMDDCTLNGDTYFTAGKCKNLEGVGSGTVWTARASGTNNAFGVDLSSGAVNSNHYRDTSAPPCVGRLPAFHCRQAML